MIMFVPIDEINEIVAHRDLIADVDFIEENKYVKKSMYKVIY